MYCKWKWRLDWPNEVRKNVQQPDDYEVQVQFSHIINLQVDIFSDEATRTNSRERSDIAHFWISVGFTPVLQRGSIWQDGCPIMFSPRNWGQEQTLSIDYQFYIPFAGTDRVRARDVIPENELLGNAFSDCWCRTLKYGSRRIVIPVWELIRFYYCNSSKLANVLFAGELTNSKLIVPKHTVLRADGIFQLYLQKDFYDADAPVILRLTQSKVAHVSTPI